MHTKKLDYNLQEYCTLFKQYISVTGRSFPSLVFLNFNDSIPQRNPLLWGSQNPRRFWFPKITLSAHHAVTSAHIFWEIYIILERHTVVMLHLPPLHALYLLSGTCIARSSLPLAVSSKHHTYAIHRYPNCGLSTFSLHKSPISHNIYFYYIKIKYLQHCLKFVPFEIKLIRINSYWTNTCIMHGIITAYIVKPLIDKVTRFYIVASNFKSNCKMCLMFHLMRTYIFSYTTWNPSFRQDIHYVNT